MQIAIDAAGFTPAEADELRQAMSAKRSATRMANLHDRLLVGMAERGIVGAVADDIIAKLSAFANFGFPESHAVSFAYLVYASAWLKLHYPAAFCAGLLNSQPMGFWSPQSLVADAQRHAVVVQRPHVDCSGVEATLQWEPDHEDPQPAVRLGLLSVRSLGEDIAQAIAAGRPYASVEDLVRRSGVRRPQLEALATAGALEGLPARCGTPPIEDRRRSLWVTGPLADATADRLPGLVVGDDPPVLAALSPLEQTQADLWATGLTVGATAVELARPRLSRLGVIPAGSLLGAETDGKVLVGGVVTHRQRPESARGTVFFNLEDETGMVNVICSPGAWVRWRRVARGCAALLVRGRLERLDGVVSVVAEKITPLDLGPVDVPPSRDFR